MTFDEACEVLDFHPTGERVTDAAKEWLVWAVNDAISRRGLEGAKKEAAPIKMIFTNGFLIPGRTREEPRSD